MIAKEDTVFPVLRSWRIRRVFAVVLGLVAALLGGAAAAGDAGWGWGLFAAVMLALAAYNLFGLTRQPWVVRIGSAGVAVRYATGRVVTAGWNEIAAHTITPGGRIGALLLHPGQGAGAREAGVSERVLPIPTRLIGAPATEALLLALKDRLPGLEYRVPGTGRGPGAR